MNGKDLEKHYQEDQIQWMRLGEAADYLGIHFTTLRRWSDAGKVPLYKTPGGRRRYKKTDLEIFLSRSMEGESLGKLPAVSETAQPEIIRVIRQLNIRDEPWYGQISPETQKMMAQNGRRLIGSLMQYASRNDGGDSFLQQGRELAREYGELCWQSGLSLGQTLQVFVSIRHSIVDSLCEAGMVVQDSGEATWNIFQRVNYFLDSIMLAILESLPNNNVLAPGEI